jgi:hypothetical protein
MPFCKHQPPSVTPADFPFSSDGHWIWKREPMREAKQRSTT